MSRSYRYFVVAVAKAITARRFAAAVDDLAALPADRYPVLPFMPRAYELRANVSAHDAAYVALAEELDCVLVTADRPAGRGARSALRDHGDQHLTGGVSGLPSP